MTFEEFKKSYLFSQLEQFFKPVLDFCQCRLHLRGLRPHPHSCLVDLGERSGPQLLDLSVENCDIGFSFQERQCVPKERKEMKQIFCRTAFWVSELSNPFPFDFHLGSRVCGVGRTDLLDRFWALRGGGLTFQSNFLGLTPDPVESLERRWKQLQHLGGTHLPFFFCFLQPEYRPTRWRQITEHSAEGFPRTTHL